MFLRFVVLLPIPLPIAKAKFKGLFQSGHISKNLRAKNNTNSVLEFVLFPYGAEKRMFCGCALKALAAEGVAEESGGRKRLAASRDLRRIPDFLSPLSATKKPAQGGPLLAQRRGFEPPDESPPSHDFQSCSLNHSDISAGTTAILQQICPKCNCFSCAFVTFPVQIQNLFRWQNLPFDFRNLSAGLNRFSAD